MERDVDDCMQTEQSLPPAQFDGQASSLSCTLSLDHVGEVALTFNSDGLSWKLVELLDNVILLSLLFFYLKNDFFDT